MYSRVSDRALFELMNEIFSSDVKDCKMTWREIKDWAASDEYKKMSEDLRAKVGLWTDRKFKL
jgi:hypothetical protein